MNDEKPKETENSQTPGLKPVGKGPDEVATEPYCPVCLVLGHREELHSVEGLPEVTKNPQVAKGAPRVVDCTAGCRYGLEPYFNPRSNGTFCYMVIRSEINPEAVVNHYWFKPEWVKPPAG